MLGLMRLNFLSVAPTDGYGVDNGRHGNDKEAFALYARVSTDKQSTENQLRELRQAAERLGWEVAQEFVDRGISGAKGGLAVRNWTRCSKVSPARTSTLWRPGRWIGWVVR